MKKLLLLLTFIFTAPISAMHRMAQITKQLAAPTVALQTKTKPASGISNELSKPEELDPKQLKEIEDAIADIAVEPNIADHAKKGNWDKVRELIEHGKDVNDTTLDGHTALHFAIYGYVAAINTTNALDKTSNIAMTKNEYIKMIKFLLQNGANYLEGGSYSVGSPLYHAATGDLALVTFMITECGIDPFKEDKYDMTILHHIAMRNDNYNKDVLNFFIDHPQANIHSKDGIGRTVLYCAARNNNYELVKILLERGANPLIGIKTDLAFTKPIIILPIRATRSIKIQLLLAHYMYPTIKKGVADYCHKQLPQWQHTATELAEMGKIAQWGAL